MATQFTVSNGIALLTPTQARDVHKIHEMKRHRDGVDQPLKEYLEFVRDEPLEWLRTLPPTWMSESYFARARSAITALCKNAGVLEAMTREGAGDLGEQVRREMKAQLTPSAVSQEIEARLDSCSRPAREEPAEPEPEREAPDRWFIVVRLRKACVAASGDAPIADVFRSMWDSGDGILDAEGCEDEWVLGDAIAELLRERPDYSRVFRKVFSFE